jgi:hypothetical protein
LNSIVTRATPMVAAATNAWASSFLHMLLSALTLIVPMDA